MSGSSVQESDLRKLKSFPLQILISKLQEKKKKNCNKYYKTIHGFRMVSSWFQQKHVTHR